MPCIARVYSASSYFVLSNTLSPNLLKMAAWLEYTFPKLLYALLEPDFESGLLKGKSHNSLKKHGWAWKFLALGVFPMYKVEIFGF